MLMMRFEDYFLDAGNVFRKDRCPDECRFKTLNSIPIVGVPLPQWPRRLQGVLVSRDPTIAFIEPYLNARDNLIEGWRHSLMAADAPPQWLVARVAEFDRKYMDGRHAFHLKKLGKVLEDNVYWTHLHKCCTDKAGKEAFPFSYENAYICGSCWLSRELSDAVALGAKFVLCLGTDVERFMYGREAPEKEQVTVLCLPHPSGAAMGAWNPKNSMRRERIADTIDELFRVVDNI